MTNKVFIATNYDIIMLPKERFIPMHSYGKWKFRSIPNCGKVCGDHKRPVFYPDWDNIEWRKLSDEIYADGYDDSEANCIFDFGNYEKPIAYLNNNADAGMSVLELQLTQLFNPTITVDSPDQRMSAIYGWYYEIVIELVAKFPKVFCTQSTAFVTDIGPIRAYIDKRLKEIDTEKSTLEIYASTNVAYDKLVVTILQMVHTRPVLMTVLVPDEQLNVDGDAEQSVDDTPLAVIISMSTDWYLVGDDIVVNKHNPGKSPYCAYSPLHEHLRRRGINVTAETLAERSREQENLYQNLLEWIGRYTKAAEARVAVNEYCATLEERINSISQYTDKQRADMLWDIKWARAAIGAWISMYMQ